MKISFLRSALALGLALPLAQSAVAQEPSTPPAPPSDTQGPPSGGPGGHRHAPDPHREAAMLGRRLNLTPDQTTRLEPILADRQSRVEALRSNSSLDEKARHQQMHSIQEDTQTKLAGVLTPDQLNQMKQMRDRRGRHDRGGPDGAYGPGGNGETPPPPPTV